MSRLLSSLALVLALTAFFAGCNSSVPLYETCENNDQCETAGSQCFTVAWMEGRDGTMCSLYCNESADCPGNSACFELVGDPSGMRACFPRCEDNLDCSTDQQCVDAEMGGAIVDSICLPN